MHLRSGRYLNIGRRSTTLARVPTEGSGTKLIGKSIDLQDSSSNSLSETSSQATTSTMSQNWGVSSNAHPFTSIGTPTRSLNPFEGDNIALPLKVPLQYVYTNAQGADIYRDPKQRYVVKIADVISELDRTPWVNDQGNFLMGRDGVCYEFTSHPEQVEKLRVLREATHAPEELLLDPNMLGPSNPNIVNQP